MRPVVPSPTLGERHTMWPSTPRQLAVSSFAAVSADANTRTPLRRGYMWTKPANAPQTHLSVTPLQQMTIIPWGGLCAHRLRSLILSINSRLPEGWPLSVAGCLSGWARTLNLAAGTGTCTPANTGNRRLHNRPHATSLGVVSV